MQYSDWQESIYIPMLGGTIGASIEVLAIWGFTRNLWSFVIFAILYGATSGGFAVLRPRFAEAIVSNEKDKEQTLLVFGILTALRGAAIIASGFIVATQLDEEAAVTSGYGGGKWRDVILYTGIVMLASSLGGLGWFTKSKSSVSEPVVAATELQSVMVQA
jgi:MFS family permease